MPFSRLIERYVSLYASLNYQEIRPLQQDGPSHYEVLVEISDFGTGKLPTGDFISALESTGTIAALDRWVISNTIYALSLRPDLGQVFVNVSAQTILNNGLFVRFLKEALGRIRPGALGFEITETARLEHTIETANFIYTVRRLGCQIAVDDFGVGNFNVGDLRKIKPDYLKIEGSLVRAIGIDKLALETTNYIIRAAHAIGAKVVAESVETTEQLELLRQWGCDYGQGWAIAYPVRLEDATRR